MDPANCAYFCKVMVVLITKKHSQLVKFIQENNLLDKLLNHIVSLIISSTHTYFATRSVWYLECKRVVVQRQAPTKNSRTFVLGNVRCHGAHNPDRFEPTTPYSFLIVWSHRIRYFDCFLVPTRMTVRKLRMG